MAFLSGDDLESTLKEVLNEQFKPERIEQAAYELSLGGEVYLTDSHKKKPEILDEKNKFVSINPGQFALLLTEETISIPNKNLGLISVKAGEKLKGLVNVSGFHVDPGFRGQLLFSVYNAGPSSITLKKGNPYFLLWLSKLTKELEEEKAYNEQENHHQGQEGIPPRYIDALKRGDIASPNVLLDEINSIKGRLSKYWWLLGILLAISIGAFTRLVWLQSKYKQGVQDGYNKKEIENRMDYKLDSIINQKTDSIFGAKFAPKNNKDTIEVNEQ